MPHTHFVGRQRRESFVKGLPYVLELLKLVKPLGTVVYFTTH